MTIRYVIKLISIIMLSSRRLEIVSYGAYGKLALFHSNGHGLFGEIGPHRYIPDSGRILLFYPTKVPKILGLDGKNDCREYSFEHGCWFYYYKSFLIFT